MSRLSTSLNYLCIAICGVGLYSTIRLVSLKPWNVSDLDQKVAAHVKSQWSSDGLAETAIISETSPAGEGISVKENEVDVGDTLVEELVVPEPPSIAETQVQEPKVAVVEVAQTGPVTSSHIAPLPSETPEPEPKFVVPGILVATTTPKLPIVEKEEVELPKATPTTPAIAVAPTNSIANLKPKAEPTPTVAQKTTIAEATVEPTPEIGAAPTISSEKHTNTNTQPAETTPVNTQTPIEKPQSAPSKSATAISLSSMLEVDLGASAPR